MDLINRAGLDGFETARLDNRHLAEEDISAGNYQLLEFDRYAPSPNDGIALRYRLAVIDDQLFNGELGFSDDRILDDEGDM